MKITFTVLFASLILFISNNVKSQVDVGVISIDSITNACSHTSAENISIQIFNFGQDTLLIGDTIPLTFVLDANAMQYDTVLLSSDFLPGDTISFTYSFTEDLSNVATYSLEASTSITIDTNTANDTLSTTIITYGYPTVILSDTVNICNGSSAQLIVSGGDSYLWSTLETTDTITVTPTTDTAYTVVVTDTNICSTTDTVYVNLNTVSVNITGNTTVCEGSSYNVSASGGTSYLWNTGDTTASVSFMPTDTTTYTVTVTNSIGCSASDSITVNLIATNFTFPTDTFVCAGDSLQMIAGGGVSYSWSTGATTNTDWITPTDTTTYYITITDANVCSQTDSFVVNYNLFPTLTTSFTDTTLCSNYPLTVTAYGADTYSWTNGDSTAIANITSSTNTTYTVTGTTNGCSISADVIVTVNQSPDINLDDEYLLYTNNSIILGVTGGYTYLWNTGETTKDIFISGDSLGHGTYNYWVKATATNGCITTDSTIINVSWGVGFNENKTTKINMYPNPTSNYLIISTNFDYFSYQLIDIKGNIISSDVVNSNVAKIDFSMFDKGIYFVKVTNNEKTFTNKIISK